MGRKVKYLYWRPDQTESSDAEEGKERVHAHFLIGYTQGTLCDLKEMADELRETFPQATDEEITCGKVIASRYVKGFTLIAWSGVVEKKEYPGWQELSSVEYGW